MVNLKNFKKVKNILYNDNYHIYYDDVFLNYDTIDHLLDEERILINDNTIKGPKYDTTTQPSNRWGVEQLLKKRGVKQKPPIEPTQPIYVAPV